MMTIKYDPNFISPYEHLDLPHAPIIFPGIKPGEFNFAAEWVVVGYNLPEQKVIIRGTEENWQLQFTDWNTPEELEQNMRDFPLDLVEYNAEVVTKLEAGEITPQQATKLYAEPFFITPEFFIEDEWLESHPSPAEEEIGWITDMKNFLKNVSAEDEARLDEIREQANSDSNSNNDNN
ncbi:hypothetical protein [Ligilactobacillus agilis]|uniref:hypothetical protein n=1 Tax=Ligilactobacillus agilis TaxID=1601 RepID=UPI001559E114|nr:hypothetical protein [Ligilactobacillus agilis]